MGSINLLYPIPAVLAGSRYRGKPNYALVADCAIVAVNPNSILISVNQKTATAAAIRESKSFSLNIPSVEQVAEADFCGINSGKSEDKSGVFTSFFGLTGAPMAKECPVNIELRLVSSADFKDNILFIGEVIESYVNEDCLVNGRPDALKINPLMYDPEGFYRSFSEWKEYAYRVGKEFKPTVTVKD